MASWARIDGDVRAVLNGDVASSSAVEVLATGRYLADADTLIVGLAAFSGSGSGTLADIIGDVEALVGSTAQITSNGGITVTATGDNDATADSDVGSGGAISFSVTLPTASIAGDTRAQFDGDVNSGDFLTVSASADYDASASSIPVNIGLLFSGAGVAANAEVSGITEAVIGALAENPASANIPDVDVGTGAVLVKAFSTMSATATADGVSAGAASVSIMLPSATVAGKTRAYVRDGVSMTAGSLSVLAGDPTPVAYDATAESFVLGLGALLGVTGIRANATVSGTVEAFVGAPTGIVAGGQPLTTINLTGPATIKAIATMDSTADADGVGAGAVSAQVMIPSAIVSGTTRAYAGEGADIDGTTLTILADGDFDADATTVAVSVGGFSGQGVDATAEVSGVVDAHVGPGAGTTPGATPTTVVLSGLASITAVSDMTSTATADGGGGGGASVSIMLPSSKVTGTTRAYVGERVHLDRRRPDGHGRGADDARDGHLARVRHRRASAQERESWPMRSPTARWRPTSAATPPPRRTTPPPRSTSATGPSLVDADGHLEAIANAKGLQGGGLVAANILLAHAVVDGTVQAYVRDGVSIDAGSLAVRAGNPDTADPVVLTATSNTFAGGLSLGVAAAGILPDAAVTGTVAAWIGSPVGTNPTGAASQVIDINGAVDVTALAHMTATSTPQALGGGLAAAVSVLLPTATISGTVRAYVGEGIDLDANSLDVIALAPMMNAIATGNALGISGFLSVNVISADAIVGGYDLERRRDSGPLRHRRGVRRRAVGASSPARSRT